MAIIQNTSIAVSPSPLGQKQTPAPTGSFLIRHLMQAPLFRTFATCCRRFGSNFARLGLTMMVTANGAVRRLAIPALWPALRMLRAFLVASVSGDVLSSSFEVSNVAGEHDSSVAAIVTMQRTTMMCREVFLGSAS